MASRRIPVTPQPPRFLQECPDKSTKIKQDLSKQARQFRSCKESWHTVILLSALLNQRLVKTYTKALCFRFPFLLKRGHSNGYLSSASFFHLKTPHRPSEPRFLATHEKHAGRCFIFVWKRGTCWQHSDRFTLTEKKTESRERLLEPQRPKTGRTCSQSLWCF